MDILIIIVIVLLAVIIGLGLLLYRTVSRRNESTVVLAKIVRYLVEQQTSNTNYNNEHQEN